MSLFLAIDGGGTKTDIILADEDGNVIKRVETSGTNANFVGFEKAIEALKNGLSNILLEQNGLNTSIKGLCAGISGSSTSDNQKKFTAFFREIFPNCRDIYVISDAEIALVNGIGNKNGGVVVSGTGLIGYAQKEGKLHSIGGYGYLIDKGGSGFDFGRDAIYAALNDYDGRGERTSLRALIEEKIKSEITDIVAQVYEKGRSYIASFAPIVFEAYKAGDWIAEQIIADNMREAAKVFRAICRYLGEGKSDIAVAGGILCNHFETLKPYLIPHFDCNVNLIFPERPPVYGALFRLIKICNS